MSYPETTNIGSNILFDITFIADWNNRRLKATLTKFSMKREKSQNQL